jgi:colicin import membrane protein
MRRLAVTIALVGVLAKIPPVAGQGEDPHAMAEAIVRDVNRDAAHRSAAASCLANATASLERATRLRAARDEPHAQAADGVALEWAMAARDLSRTLEMEAKAVQARRAAIETQAQVERAHALVDEGIARVGRLKAEIERMEREAAPGRVAVERHDQPADKDARGPSKPPHAPQTAPPVDAGPAP